MTNERMNNSAPCIHIFIWRTFFESCSFGHVFCPLIAASKLVWASCSQMVKIVIVVILWDRIHVLGQSQFICPVPGRLSVWLESKEDSLNKFPALADILSAVKFIQACMQLTHKIY